jgi:hypothetical protein
MILGFAMKWILRDSIDVSGSRSIIGADEMIPLFTMVLIHAQIPNMHLLLSILMNYGEYDEQGDVSYNIASLEGSMRFILEMKDIPVEMHEAFHISPMAQSIMTSFPRFHRSRSGTNSVSHFLSTPQNLMGKPLVSTTATAKSTIPNNKPTNGVTLTTQPGKGSIPTTDNIPVTTTATSSHHSTPQNSPATLQTTPEQSYQDQFLRNKSAEPLQQVQSPSAAAAAATTTSTTTTTPSSLSSPSLLHSTSTKIDTPPIESDYFHFYTYVTQQSSNTSSLRMKSGDRFKEDQEAMEQLGEWLRDQKTMEDTIAILQSDGWML